MAKFKPSLSSNLELKCSRVSSALEEESYYHSPAQDLWKALNPLRFPPLYFGSYPPPHQGDHCIFCTAVLRRPETMDVTLCQLTPGSCYFHPGLASMQSWILPCVRTWLQSNNEPCTFSLKSMEEGFTSPSHNRCPPTTPLNASHPPKPILLMLSTVFLRTASRHSTQPHFSIFSQLSSFHMNLVQACFYPRELTKTSFTKPV